MSDIVERLRGQEWEYPYQRALVEEAAAEIERLTNEAWETFLANGELALMLREKDAEIERLRADLKAAVEGNARVIRALDAAVQWGEALFAFLPEGMVLPEGVKTAKEALTQALRDIRR